MASVRLYSRQFISQFRDSKRFLIRSSRESRHRIRSRTVRNQLKSTTWIELSELPKLLKSTKNELPEINGLNRVHHAQETVGAIKRDRFSSDFQFIKQKSILIGGKERVD